MRIIELLFLLSLVLWPSGEQPVTESRPRPCVEVLSESPGAVVFPVPEGVYYRSGAESSGPLFVVIKTEVCQ